MVKELPSKQLIWVRIPLFTMLNNQIVYYTLLQQFLIKNGKKNNMEKVFQNLLVERAKKSKQITGLFDLLTKCKQNSTPYIFFNSKGKNNRQNYRINLLGEHTGIRRALLSLGKYIRKINGIKLYLNLEKEIESLGRNKSRHILCLERNKLFILGLRGGVRSGTKKEFEAKTSFFTKKLKRVQFLSKII